MQLKTEHATAASPEAQSVLLLLISEAVYWKVKLLTELPD
jgi:hypothetical protein